MVELQNMEHFYHKLTSTSSTNIRSSSYSKMLFSRAPSRTQIFLVLSVSALVGLGVLNHFKTQLHFLWITRVLPDLAPNCHPSLLDIVDTRSTQNTSEPIPNIVHYVWLIQDRPHFVIDFKTFISIYSTHVYFNPEVIYIHTDATPEQFEAAKSSSDESTRWALKVPNVVHHQVEIPKHTSLCRNIHKIQHSSDFVRTQQLYEHGGIYVDTDVIPLRSITPLLNSGFSNIVGLEEPGRTNNGFTLSKPGSALMSIFRTEQHRVFDNRWTTHSVNLLSSLAHRLQAVPDEVLILGIKAFTPSTWKKEDIDTLFKPNNKIPPSLPSNTSLPVIPTSFQDAVSYWKARDEGRDPWEVDYSSSYVIHAFDGSPERYWPKHVSLEYVVRRQSNYARAVYPAVQHAIDAGVIDRRPRL